MSGQTAGKMPRIRFKGFEGEWEEKELGELADIKLGKMLDKVKHTSGQLLPYLNNISLRWNDVDTSNLPQMYFKDDELERFGLKAGDVVVCEGGEPGRSAIWDGHLPNLKFQKAIHRVRFNVPYEAPLLVLHLQNIVGTNRFEMLFTGGGIKHLTRETFSLLVVPQPSLQEQRDVAHFLSELDNLIGLHQRKHDKLVTLKKSMLQKMFPQPGTTTPEIRFKGFSGDWVEKKLGELMPITSAARVHKHEWTRSGVPFFRTSDVVSLYKGEENAKTFISLDLYEKLSEKIGRIKRGDILITGGGSIGIPYLTESDDPLYFKDADLLWLKVPEIIDSIYLYTFFSSDPFREYLGSISHIGTIGHYTVEQAKKTPITIPLQAEQQKIGTYFRTLDALISKHATQLQKLQQIKSACLQRMFV